MTNSLNEGVKFKKKNPTKNLNVFPLYIDIDYKFVHHPTFLKAKCSFFPFIVIVKISQKDIKQNRTTL